MKDFDPHHSDADTHQKNTGKDILTKNVSRKVSQRNVVDESSANINVARRNSKTIIEFTGRAHELHNLSRRIALDHAVSNEEIKPFEYELTGKFHQLDVDELVTKLESDIDTGLSCDDAKIRLLKFGPNCIAKSKEQPLWVKFLLSFLKGFSPILWVAAFFVFLSWKPFGSPPSDVYNLALAIVLLIVIFLSGLFNFHQEVAAAQLMSSIDNMIPITCFVQRDGKSIEIGVQNIVVGDICFLIYGMKIPADLRIIEASSLRVDTSMLTGEQEPIKMTTMKARRETGMLHATNIGFMGCNIVEGEGKGIVVATGKESQLSKIADQVSNTMPITGLQKDLNHFVAIICSMAAGTVVIVALVWALYLRVYHPHYMKLSSFIANAISVVVAFVPEGLPLAMSMGLSIIADRLCKEHKVIVKQLSIVETIGSMSLLATDKTGTLTQNVMTITNLITRNGCVPIDDLDLSKADSLIAERVLLFLQLGSLFCNQAKIDVKDASTSQLGCSSNDPVGFGDPSAINNEPAAPVFKGNGVDVALMKWVISSPATVSDLQSAFTVRALIPFSSTTKVSAVVIAPLLSTHLLNQSNEATRCENICSHVILKGAPDYVLARCLQYIDDDGSEVPLTPAVINDIRKHIELLASKGGRVIAIAKLSLDQRHYNEGFVFRVDGEPNFPITGLTFVCSVAVSDPPRKGVIKAVEDLRRAGVKIVMVTGDAPTTAIAIARQVGLITVPNILDGATLLSGSDGWSAPDTETASEDCKQDSNSYQTTALFFTGANLENMSATEWDRLSMYKEVVFSRVTPEQKLLIVKEFQRRGERVGVTGDGVNDSPALKRADVGIAMNSGSEVAKDAADVVLLEDNFAAIVKGVEEGRLIFTNLRKVVAYQISAGSWAELLPVLATFFLGIPQPLSAFLMIIISCITDVFAGVALTRERSEVSLMTQPPRDLKKEPLVRLSLIAYSYLFYGTLESVASFATYFLYMSNRGPHVKYVDENSPFPLGYPPSQLLFAWNWGNDPGKAGQDNIQAAITASSVFFIVLIVCQWGHLISIRRSTPYFSDSILDTQRKGGSLLSRLQEEVLASTPKPSIVLAIVCSAIAGIFFTEVPVVQTSCGTNSVPPFYWGLAILFSIAIFIVAELRKWLMLGIATRKSVSFQL